MLIVCFGVPLLFRISCHLSSTPQQWLQAYKWTSSKSKHGTVYGLFSCLLNPFLGPLKHYVNVLSQRPFAASLKGGGKGRGEEKRGIRSACHAESRQARVCWQISKHRTIRAGALEAQGKGAEGWPWWKEQGSFWKGTDTGTGKCKKAMKSKLAPGVVLTGSPSISVSCIFFLPFLSLILILPAEAVRPCAIRSSIGGARIVELCE